MNLEFYSSNLYLQMSAWCEQQGFEGAAKIFYQSMRLRKMQHMRKLFTYLNETGAFGYHHTNLMNHLNQFSSLKQVLELTL